MRDHSDTYENLIVFGGFNARHFSWDSAGVNPNGIGLAEAVSFLDLHLLNTGELLSSRCNPNMKRRLPLECSE